MEWATGSWDRAHKKRGRHSAQIPLHNLLSPHNVFFSYRFKNFSAKRAMFMWAREHQEFSAVVVPLHILLFSSKLPPLFFLPMPSLLRSTFFIRRGRRRRCLLLPKRTRKTHRCAVLLPYTFSLKFHFISFHPLPRRPSTISSYSHWVFFFVLFTRRCFSLPPITTYPIWYQNRAVQSVQTHQWWGESFMFRVFSPQCMYSSTIAATTGQKKHTMSLEWNYKKKETTNSILLKGIWFELNNPSRHAGMGESKVVFGVAENFNWRFCVHTALKRVREKKKSIKKSKIRGNKIDSARVERWMMSYGRVELHHPIKAQHQSVLSCESIGGEDETRQ